MCGKIKQYLREIELLVSNKIILYGAGTYGKKAWHLLSPQLRKKVIAFAVTENGGAQLFGLPIKTIYELQADCDTATVMICAVGAKVRDMSNTLSSLGFSSCMLFNENVLLYAAALSQVQEENAKSFLRQLSVDEVPYDEKALCNRALSVGKFIRSLGTEGLTFSRLPFVWGGSGVLDYALLRGLAIKFALKCYLEVGTYIGASLACLDDVVEHCFSVTVPPDDPRHMRHWCEVRHIKDFSNCLVDESKVTQFLEDSTYFDYSRTGGPIDLYFIDGDHSYRGVFIDSIKIFDHFDPEKSFVVWHDCHTAQGIATEVVSAVHDAIGSYWKDFFVFDACMCGIYIPPCYQKDFTFAKQSDGLVTYKVVLQQNQ